MESITVCVDVFLLLLWQSDLRDCFFWFSISLEFSINLCFSLSEKRKDRFYLALDQNSMSSWIESIVKWSSVKIPFDTFDYHYYSSSSWHDLVLCPHRLNRLHKKSTSSLLAFSRIHFKVNFIKLVSFTTEQLTVHLFISVFRSCHDSFDEISHEYIDEHATIIEILMDDIRSWWTRLVREWVFLSQCLSHVWLSMDK